jgi:hypothetical protein
MKRVDLLIEHDRIVPDELVAEPPGVNEEGRGSGEEEQ